VECAMVKTTLRRMTLMNDEIDVLFTAHLI
jgi:hypothetical protein